MTAIAYTSLIYRVKEEEGGKWIKKLGPRWIKREGSPSQNLFDFILQMHRSGFKVTEIGSIKAHAFRRRYSEDATKKNWETINPINIHTNQVSSIDDENQGRFLPPIERYIGIPQSNQSPLPNSSAPQIGLAPTMYNIDSYVTRGILSGVSMRAHASGSAPLTLAAMQFINSQGIKPNIIDEEELAIHAGIIIATYEAGDYHSPAETAAGFCHYHQTIKKERIYVTNTKPEDEQYLDEIEPKNFLAMAVGFLSNIVSDDKIDEFNALSQKVAELVYGKCDRSDN